MKHLLPIAQIIVSIAIGAALTQVFPGKPLHDRAFDIECLICYICFLVFFYWANYDLNKKEEPKP